MTRTHDFPRLTLSRVEGLQGDWYDMTQVTNDDENGQPERTVGMNAHLE